VNCGGWWVKKREREREKEKEKEKEKERKRERDAEGVLKIRVIYTNLVLSSLRQVWIIYVNNEWSYCMRG
jgi:hypothetical protein